MRRSKFRRPCKVLIFNGARVLVAIVRSLHCAAELTHENKSAIHNCCTGKSVRSGAYYYRQLHPDILLRWTIWTSWHSKSMTTCVASNESISPPARWPIFARGQRRNGCWKVKVYNNPLKIEQKTTARFFLWYMLPIKS